MGLFNKGKGNQGHNAAKPGSGQVGFQKTTKGKNNTPAQGIDMTDHAPNPYTPVYATTPPASITFYAGDKHVEAEWNADLNVVIVRPVTRDQFGEEQVDPKGPALYFTPTRKPSGHGDLMAQVEEQLHRTGKDIDKIV